MIGYVKRVSYQKIVSSNQSSKMAATVIGAVMSSKQTHQTEEKSVSKQKTPQPEVQNLEALNSQVPLTSTVQQARLYPRSLTQRRMLQLQRTIGNREVGRLIGRPPGRSSSSALKGTIQRGSDFIKAAINSGIMHIHDATLFSSVRKIIERLKKTLKELGIENWKYKRAVEKYLNTWQKIIAKFDKDTSSDEVKFANAMSEWGNKKIKGLEKFIPGLPEFSATKLYSMNKSAAITMRNIEEAERQARETKKGGTSQEDTILQAFIEELDQVQDELGITASERERMLRMWNARGKREADQATLHVYSSDPVVIRPEIKRMLATLRPKTPPNKPLPPTPLELEEFDEAHPNVPNKPLPPIPEGEEEAE